MGIFIMFIYERIDEFIFDLFGYFFIGDVYDQDVGEIVELVSGKIKKIELFLDVIVQVIFFFIDFIGVDVIFEGFFFLFVVNFIEVVWVFVLMGVVVYDLLLVCFINQQYLSRFCS